MNKAINTSKRLTYSNAQTEFNSMYPYMYKIKYDKLAKLFESIKSELPFSKNNQAYSQSIYRYIDAFIYAFSPNAITQETFKELSAKMIGLVRSLKYAYEGNFGTYYGRTKIDELPTRVKDSLLALIPEKAVGYYFNKATTERTGNIWSILQSDSDEKALLKIKNFFNAHINWGKTPKEISTLLLGSREIIESTQYPKCNEYLYYKILFYSMLKKELQQYRPEGSENLDLPLEKVAEKINDLNTYTLLKEQGIQVEYKEPLYEEDERLPKEAREKIKEITESWSIENAFSKINEFFKLNKDKFDTNTMSAIFENILSNKIKMLNVNVSKLNISMAGMEKNTIEIYKAIKNFKAKEEVISNKIKIIETTKDENTRKKAAKEIYTILEDDLAFKEHLKINASMFEKINKILGLLQEEKDTSSKGFKQASPSEQFPLVYLLSKDYRATQQQVDDFAKALLNFFNTMRLSTEDESAFATTVGRPTTDKIKNIYVGKKGFKIDENKFIDSLYDTKNSKAKEFFTAVKNKLSQMYQSSKQNQTNEEKKR